MAAFDPQNDPKKTYGSVPSRLITKVSQDTSARQLDTPRSKPK